MEVQQPAAVPFRKRWGGVLVTLTALGVLAAIFAWRWWPPRRAGILVDDPRSSLPSPFKNVRPDVVYVGDNACVGCHAGIAETYARHPMGQSLFPAADAPPLEAYDERHFNPFEGHALRYLVERRERSVFHREARLDAAGGVVAEKAEEVHYAIGSGIRGRSYLVERDGFLFESPISWYTQKGRWDLSPGYHKRNRHFERPVLADCLFCHTNQVRPVGDTINRYEPPIFRGHAIGCERCHGPGGLHVAARERIDGVDITIVNPRHLEPALRDSVCEQCHLQGESRVTRLGRDVFDYRPGLPLHLFASVFVRLPDFTDNHKAISQPEQMRVSKCYQRSNGKLGCISCHDPHRLPAADERVAYFRERCLSCHQDPGCALPEPARLKQNAEDSCIACHMPGLQSDIVHVAQTDHRIRRRPSDASAKSAEPPRDLRPGEIPLLHFHQHLLDPKDRSVSRDLGLGLVVQARKSEGTAVAGWLTRLATPVLESASIRWPDDVPTLEGYGYALWHSGRRQEAAAVYEQAIRKSPRRELAITDYVDLLNELNRPEEAIALCKRAVEINPYRVQYHNSLGRLYAETEQWTLAVAAFRKTLQLNPFRIPARRRLIECLLRAGEQKAAEAEFEFLLKLDAENGEALQRWWADRANWSTRQTRP